MNINMCMGFNGNKKEAIIGAENTENPKILPLESYIIKINLIKQDYNILFILRSAKN